MYNREVARVHPAWWPGVVVGMTLWGLLAFRDDIWRLAAPALGGVVSRPLVVAAFIAVVIAHAIEALWAYRLATRSGRQSRALGWLVQTFILGVPSLRLLRRRIREDQG